jgi:ABC-type transport system substrate-binding protein
MKNLVVALTDAPPRNRLNPYESNTLHIHAVIWPIYEPLFDIGPDMEFRPRLAESWSSSANGRELVFQLRRRVTFQPSGAAFTAQSVVDNLQQLVRGSSFRARILSDLIDFGGTKAVDHYTVKIDLKYPKPELLFLALMADSDDKGKPPLGTGPFYLDPDQPDFVLKTNPAYRPQPAKLHQITFESIPPEDVMDKFREGLVDFVRDVDPDSIGSIPEHQTHTVRPFGLHYLGFNLKSTVFADPKIRRAFRDLIDFREIASKTGLRPANGPIPPDVEGYDPTPPTSHQDPGAKGALDQARKGLKIKVMFNKYSYYGRKLADRIMHDLGETTVDMEPQESSRELLETIKNRRSEADHCAFIYNWYSILPAAEIFLRPLFGSEVRAGVEMPDNLTRYNDKEFEKRLGEAQARDISAEERTKRYRNAQRRIIDDVPAIFLGHSRVRYSAHNARVSGLALNVQSFPVDRYLGVDVL